MNSALPTGTVTFLTTDLVSFSAFFEHDEDRARQSTLRHLACVQETVERHGGSVFKTVGDSVWAAFSSAPSAVRCALAISESAYPETEKVRLPIRVALLTGDAQPIEGDYFEKAVNRCSRLCEECGSGQILVGRSTYELTKDQFEFRSHGEIRLKGVPALETWELAASKCEGAAVVWLDPARKQPPSHNFPQEDRPFIGRSKEQAELFEMLQDSRRRVTTITGIGGIGKSRLARQVGPQLPETFPDGVTLIQCDHLITREELFTAVVSNINGGAYVSSEQELAEVLNGRSCLLVLDCFERLVHERSFIDRLMQSTENVRVLVTSRTLVGLHRERELCLGPMSCEHHGENLSEAEQLFWDVASDVAPGIGGTRKNRSAAHEIVRLLEGVPLAVVLAASRLRHMAIPELLQQVKERRLDTLRSRNDSNDKHASLLQVIDSSFTLLTDRERQVMADLSVFRGFYMEDALAILPEGIVARDDIESLREHSLLSSQIHGPRMRFRLLDTVREYVEIRHSEKVREEVRLRHAERYTEFAEACCLGEDRALLRFTGSAVWAEIGNIREGFSFAAARSRSDLVRRQAKVLCRPLVESGMCQEFRSMRDTVSGLGEIEEDLAIELSGLNGVVERMNGNLEGAIAAWEERASLCRRAGDHLRERDTLKDLTDLALTAGRIDIARGTLSRFEAITGDTTDGTILLLKSVLRARLDLSLGEYPEAMAEVATALQITDEVMLDADTFFIWHRLGSTLKDLGDKNLAEELYLKGLSTAASMRLYRSAAAFLLDLAALYSEVEAGERESKALALLLSLPCPVAQAQRSQVTSHVRNFARRHGAQGLTQSREQVGHEGWPSAIQAFCRAPQPSKDQFRPNTATA